MCYFYVDYNFMKCPRCYSEDSKIVKNGRTYNNKQRYMCKNCFFNFSIFSKRGMSNSTKLKALELHFEGLSFRAIGRDLGVSNVTVLRWIRKSRRKLRQIIKDRIELRRSQITQLKEMDLREMWFDFLQRRKEYKKSKIKINDLI